MAARPCLLWRLALFRAHLCLLAAAHHIPSGMPFRQLPAPCPPTSICSTPSLALSGVLLHLLPHAYQQMLSLQAFFFITFHFYAGPGPWEPALPGKCSPPETFPQPDTNAISKPAFLPTSASLMGGPAYPHRKLFSHTTSCVLAYCLHFPL